MKSLIAHQFANMVPKMKDIEVADLATRIKEGGLTHKGKLFQGHILDGRHRAIACEKAGVKMEWEEFAGTEQEAFEHVMNENCYRRQMSLNDRAWLIVEAEKLRDLRGWETPPRGGLDKKEDSEQSPPRGGLTVEKQAEVAQVSKRTLERVRQIDRDGVAALKKMSKENKVPIKTAAAVAALPKAKQKQLVAQGPKALTAAVREDVRDYSNAYNSKPAAPLIQTRAGLAKDSTMSTLTEKLVLVEDKMKYAKQQSDWAAFFVKRIEEAHRKPPCNWHHATVVAIIEAIRA